MIFLGAVSSCCEIENLFFSIKILLYLVNELFIAQRALVAREIYRLEIFHDLSQVKTFISQFSISRCATKSARGVFFASFFTSALFARADGTETNIKVIKFLFRGPCGGTFE